MVAEVHAPVFDTATDPSSPVLGEACDEAPDEATPIFYALARHADDPVEHFRRDPLRAPLPSLLGTTPAMARMLLQSVPSALAGAARTELVERAERPEGGSHRTDNPGARLPVGGRRHRVEPHRVDATGGRHRALRSVQH